MKNKNRKFGYIFFAMGIALLLLTFSLAIYTYLWYPGSMDRFLKLIETGGGTLDELVNVMIHLIPVVLLLVMGIIGGRIAKYGIKLVRSPEYDEAGLIGGGAL